MEGLCVVVWRGNGGWLWVLSYYAINMGFHGQQSTVWQMKHIHSRQLFLMRMESDGNRGGRASHSAVWGDRKWEDHSIATTPSQMAPGRSVPLSTVSVCVWCSGGGMIVVTEPRRVAAVTMSQRVAYEMELSQKYCTHTTQETVVP